MIVNLFKISFGTSVWQHYRRRPNLPNLSGAWTLPSVLLEWSARRALTQGLGGTQELCEMLPAVALSLGNPCPSSCSS